MECTPSRFHYKLCVEITDLGARRFVRAIEQCCFNSVPDPSFNGQTVNFILKPPKVIESRTYVRSSGKNV